VFELMGWDPEATRIAIPTYPCLIDENHTVPELYDIINVPAAVWIDEQGRIVRPPDSAGACDVFRVMDRTTFRMPKEAADHARQERKAYITALRDWIENGAPSKYVMRADELRRLLPGPDAGDQLAAAHFRLGLELDRLGRTEEAKSQFAEAKRLRPESWSYKRQAWELEQPGKAAGPEFWSAVDALGDKHYYSPTEL
jgi:tetratricopeptide (TPR) repeat protein